MSIEERVAALEAQIGIKKPRPLVQHKEKVLVASSQHRWAIQEVIAALQKFPKTATVRIIDPEYSSNHLLIEWEEKA